MPSRRAQGKLHVFIKHACTCVRVRLIYGAYCNECLVLVQVQLLKFIYVNNVVYCAGDKI